RTTLPKSPLSRPVRSRQEQPVLRFGVRIRVVALMTAASAAAVVHVPHPVAAQDDILRHFKYGSIGGEETVGIPYPLWRVLPLVFADKLPDRPGSGYERLGFVFEPDAPQGRPIGTSYRDGLVPLVGLN